MDCSRTMPSSLAAGTPPWGWGWGVGHWAKLLNRAPFQLSVCSSCETKMLTTCLFCPRALTCSIPKMMVQATFSIMSQEKVEAWRAALPPRFASTAPEMALPLLSIWSDSQLPSVHSTDVEVIRCTWGGLGGLAGDSPGPALELAERSCNKH